MHTGNSSDLYIDQKGSLSFQVLGYQIYRLTLEHLQVSSTDHIQARVIYSYLHDSVMCNLSLMLSRVIFIKDGNHRSIHSTIQCAVFTHNELPLHYTILSII